MFPAVLKDFSIILLFLIYHIDDKSSKSKKKSEGEKVRYWKRSLKFSGINRARKHANTSLNLHKGFLINLKHFNFLINWNFPRSENLLKIFSLRSPFIAGKMEHNEEGRVYTYQIIWWDYMFHNYSANNAEFNCCFYPRRKIFHLRFLSFIKLGGFPN